MSDKVLCPLCNCDMASPTTKSCLSRKGIKFEDGSMAAALPYGPDPEYPDLNETNDFCRDCNVAYGGTHHMHCCVETCPRCDGQLLSCDCHAVRLVAMTKAQWQQAQIEQAQRQDARQQEAQRREARLATKRASRQKLLAGKATHHLDDDPTNTDPSNLLLFDHEAHS